MTEIRVVEVGKPPVSSKITKPNKYDPFAPSTNWMMDESMPSSIAQEKRVKDLETPTKAPPVSATVAPRKQHAKYDPFASSTNWMQDEKPDSPPSVPKTKRVHKPPQVLTPIPQVQEQPARKKYDPFAPSTNWMMDEKPESPPRTQIIRSQKPPQVQASVQQVQEQPTQPKRKRNDFASSLAFGSPEKQSFPKIAEESIIKQTHTVET